MLFQQQRNWGKAESMELTNTGTSSNCHHHSMKSMHNIIQKSIMDGSCGGLRPIIIGDDSNNMVASRRMK